MDSWTEREIKSMQVGGNKQMNDFLSSHKVSRRSSIKKKYNSSAAALYREVYVFLAFILFSFHFLALLLKLKVANLLQVFPRVKWFRKRSILHFLLLIM